MGRAVQVLDIHQPATDSRYNFGMRILHILDHSLPLQSGYVFRTLSILEHQRKLGWETFHLTTPRHTAPYLPTETIDGWDFHRTPAGFRTCGEAPGVPRMGRDGGDDAPT